jgi:glycosyltransferase involved in cell wall biosynthesis
VTSPARSVLIDATSVPPDRGGVGRYLDGIIPALAASGAAVSVVCKPADVEHFRASGLTVVAAPASTASTARRFVWEQLSLPGIAKRAGADTIHSPHYTFPLLTRRARVVTVHDLTFFSHPELHTAVKRVFFRSWIRLSRLFRTVVVAPSSATASEYVRYTGADRGRVVVALHGYDHDHFHLPTDAESATLAASFDPPVGRWIAFLGTLEPRKNVVALIEGYQSATSELPASERPSLLLAGGPGWDSGIEPAIEAAVARGFDVRKLGYLPLDTLSAFLGGAEIVAYPSLGEGFGLPVLEAMATGACVLTTRRLALPEVGGDAVAYTETDASSIASAVSRLMQDPAERGRLGSAAVARAHEFTWARCAASHTDAYERAGAR